eukprot:TRINITY_DN90608_c0_g1_i1.p1 TRINITY_DN90608_c0_g1~~TRINITY_DN90608_c0_g1_i1.p1  ORF type:complete len:803 (-),score=148.40 TRINITY_DN90608_c0_g1_i1:22-2430(-)
MTSVLPYISKPITVATPRKGKHGLFSSPPSDEPQEDNIHTQPWHPLTFSESTASLASHASGSHPGFLPPATPRRTGPFAPEIDAQSLELAPPGWARTPRTPRLHGDSQRVVGDGKQLVEAKRALRGIGPGDWNAALFARYRKQFMEEGRWLAIPGLYSVALKSSQEALDAGWYSLSSRPGNRGERVVLPQKSHCQWQGMDDIMEPEPCVGMVPPPIICSHRTPLDCARVLGKLYPKNEMFVTLEATDFTKLGAGTDTGAGHLLEGEECRSLGLQEMHIRTNFKFASRMASNLCAKGPSPRERLAAKTDPQIFVVEELALFRGDAPDGYPFLPEEDQLKLTALVSGRAVKRPWLVPRQETFLNQDDLICFMDRLNLLTYRALSASEPGTPQPVLVLGLCGLTDAEHRQPRGSIVQALKVWRSTWAGLFQAVVVACGDENAAHFFDRSVNLDVYMEIMQNQPVKPAAHEWHWDMGLVDLSENKVLATHAAKVALQRQYGAGAAFTQGAPDGRRMSGTRRHSGAGLFMLGQALSDKPAEAGAILKSPAAPASPKSDASTPWPDPAQRAAGRRDSNARRASHASNASNLEVPKRRLSQAIGMDGKAENARDRAERLANLRMDAEKAKDPMEHARQTMGAGHSAGGEDVRKNVAMAAAAFQEFGRGGGPLLADHGPQPGLLEKRKIMQAASAMYSFPADLQAFVSQAIEKNKKFQAVQEKPNNKTKETEGAAEVNEDDEEDEDHEKKPIGVDEVTRVFDEVQDLAASLDQLLSSRRGEKAPMTSEVKTSGSKTKSALFKVASTKLLT